MIKTKVLGSQTIRNFAKRIMEAKLHRKLVKFDAENGKKIELEAVYEDSLSTGSSVGTVVGYHGSPGSHNDFKYVRDKLDQMDIRFIGINYPGFTNTDSYKGQQHGNVERQNYTNALLNELGISGKMIYMGHSRGCENALQTAVERDAHGLVLVNPTGLRIHRGVRPMYRLEAINSLYNVLPVSMANSMMLAIYKAIGFKIQTGDEAINALRSMIRVSLGGQLKYIEKSNPMNMKKLVVFGGKDHLVEDQIIFESLEKHKGLKHFDFESDLSEEEKKKVMEAFAGNESRGASVFVKNDTHFQNKSRADLIAAACQTMFSIPANKHKL